ncbi:TetR family transcriptional regulator [Mycobacterium kyorinense]|uniref:TetR family transcriptional regulator n=1 Tax=Mycobacterium kyorinense TaxID=487514 RepID=UPI0018D4CA8F|nr:TetR family transcriptional regulator [Mycobacterium kyorinense]
MSNALNFQAEVRQLLRDRVLDAAYALVCAEGWRAVNMSQIAAMVGVSRQVLYKEFGAKQGLGKALVGRETERFITGVISAMRAHPDDIAAGLAAGAAFTLRAGAEDALVKANLARARDGDTGLTPLLTTGPTPIWAGAMKAIATAVREFYDLPAAIDRQLDSIVEVDVRLTFSHLLQPMNTTVDDAVQQIHTTLSALLGAVTS